MFHANGRLITVHPKKIVINALRDEEEAEKILQWLKREINDAWEKRHEIEPSESIAEKPKLIEVLKRLPKTNCGECGHPTCMVFSSMVIQGIKGPEQCPPLDDDNRQSLKEYLGQFNFIDI
jgi:ArsR family metal-binding transcriptional regulator